MLTRRLFLRSTTTALISASLFPLTSYAKHDNSSRSRFGDIGPLTSPDSNGLMLPDGFSSRIIARSGLKPITQSSYLWHDAPDGGATFPSDDGGWIYVSNSEVDHNFGGCGAIRFDSSGNTVNAYSILEDTSRNCAGGATPWGTWLSCEEIGTGLIWECDPNGKQSAIPRPALGAFAHEAVALDTRNQILYMTEDRTDGGFYRFIPGEIDSNARPNLNSGTLEVAVVDASTSTVSWVSVKDPDASSKPVRYQVENRTAFNGGEGIVFHNGVVSFATKGDNRIWSYATSTRQLSIIYDAKTHMKPILTGVDNITLSLDGELVVGEDGGDLQLVAITKTNKLVPLIQLAGHDFSEVTGPAFSPDGMHLYFSSQRGTTGKSSGGITYEVTGPFHTRK